MSIFLKILVLSKNTSIKTNLTQTTFVLPTKTYQVICLTPSKYLSLDTSGFYSANLNITSSVRCLSNFSKIDLLVPSPSRIEVGEGWEYREFNEFFSNIFSLRKDSRNLLLDYIQTSKPLRKSYPTTGFSEFFYNNSKQKTMYTPINNIEL